MVSTLIETININADDFTDNFLTCPTCMGSYDENEHCPKLLPCSHTLCKACLERIAATSVPVASGSILTPNGLVQGSLQQNPSHNSLSRTVAAADSAAAIVAANNSSPFSSQSILNHTSSQILEQCFKCPICRETIAVPRNGGVSSLPPSFVVNQLLDLIKNQRRDLVPRCSNHPNEELLFCETCDQAFCSICENHCREVSNADHIVIPFSIAIKRMTEIFLFKSNQCINSFNFALGNVQHETENLNKTVENVIERVDASFNELKSLLDTRREELLKNLYYIKESKTKVLNEQMNLIKNEKQKVEQECSKYQQSKMESKLLGAQIQKLNEKLDCLRSLFEPRENSFINYEYKFNNVIEKIESSIKDFGRFKVSNTYPPLCTAKFIDNFSNIDLLNTMSSVELPNCSNTSFNSFLQTPAQSSHYPMQSFNDSSTINCSANLTIFIQIDTVDYYGQKQTEGGDPVNILITDPYGRQQSLSTPNQIVDFKKGTYVSKFIPTIPGKYRFDVSIFMRPINKMPLYMNVSEFIDSIWTFGGSSHSTSNNFSFCKGIVTSKGTSDRDFNMPICVRCIKGTICVLDSGNNRIKLLNEQGQFIRHITHIGLSETSCTALTALKQSLDKFNLITINWRTKILSDYEVNFVKSTEIDEKQILLKNHELSDPLITEPIALMETSNKDLFIIQDKKKFHLCSSTGVIIYESLEVKMKTECNIKNITTFCGNTDKLRVFVGDLTSSSANIYELDINWLCDYKLETILNSIGIMTFKPDPKNFTFRKYQPIQSLSTSNSSLNSNFSISSSTTNSTTLTTHSLATLSTQNSLNMSTSGSALMKGTYTALWFDTNTKKLLAAKCDKQKKTVIEVYNSQSYLYEYAIENSKNEEKPFRRVTSMCCTSDGKVVCVDLVQNCVKIFRFI